MPSDAETASANINPRLTPDERAVFLLREAFDYKFAEIADIAGGQVTAIRSIVNPDKLAHLGPVSDRSRR